MFSPLLFVGKKSPEFSERIFFDAGYIGAADGKISGNLPLC